MWTCPNGFLQNCLNTITDLSSLAEVLHIEIEDMLVKDLWYETCKLQCYGPVC